MYLLTVLLLYLPTLVVSSQSPWIEYPDTGTATMTHYTLPSGFVAACGCTPSSTDYPTAALSQMAYGSSTAFGAHRLSWVFRCWSTHDLEMCTLSDPVGPSCGRCFNLTLLQPVYATPPFIPSVVKSIVVKVTDLCPLSRTGLCSGTTTKPNSSVEYIILMRHFYTEYLLKVPDLS